MKKIVAIVSLTFISAAAVAQSRKDAPQPILVTSMASTAAKITTRDIIINPNPVKGPAFSLELQNLDKGRYNIYLFDNKGKKYLVKTLNTEGGTSTENLDLPKEITQGTYILQVISKTARFSKKLVVEQLSPVSR
jgi:hypothetical protein